MGESPETVSPPTGQDSALTTQERAVLAASATGLITDEVGELLGLSPEVVRGSITSAIEKLGARSKLEAVILALRRGLINLTGSSP